MIDRIVVLMLAALFLFSGIDKILHFSGFLDALRNYVVLPRWAAPYVGPPVVATELMIGIGLLLKVWRRPAALTAAIAMGLFTVALLANYFFGSRGICGCWFTITLASSSELHILQNLVFGGLAAMVWWEERGAPKAPAIPVSPDSAPPATA